MAWDSPRWGRRPIVLRLTTTIVSLAVASLIVAQDSPAAAAGGTWGAYDVGFGNMAFGPDGTLYTSDCANARIYRVSRTGVLSVFAGAGSGGFDNGYSGDGGPALGAHFGCPVGLAFDKNGNLFVADHLNNVVRKIDTSGVVSTVAGIGPPAHWWFKGPSAPSLNHFGDGGSATQAELDRPWGLTFDAAGNLYIADRDHDAVRKVDTNGIITTVVGTGQRGYSGDGGLATNARLNRPLEVAFRNGNMYIADENNARIRRVDSNGVITTFGGTGGLGCSGNGGAAIAAPIQNPTGITFGPDGSLYMSETECHAVRRIDSGGVLHAVLGTGADACSGLDGGSALSADVADPQDVSFGPRGELYVSGPCNSILRIDSSEVVHVFATAPAA